MRKFYFPKLELASKQRGITILIGLFVLTAVLFVVIPRRGALDFVAVPSAATPPAKSPTPVTEDLQKVVPNFDRDYDYSPVGQAAGTVRIPILAYHHIAPLPAVGSAGRELYVSPDMFDKQMAYLKAKEYRTLTTREYYQMLKAGQNPVQKSVLLTFGDGYDDNYTNAFQILKKYGLVGNFYIIAGRLQIKPEQFLEMEKAGMTIEGHSMTHIALGAVYDPNIVQKEVVDSKREIEALSGQPVFSFLYPNCTYNDATLAKVQANYSMALACGAAIDNSPADIYHLQRVYMYENYDNFKKRLSGIMEEAVY